MGWDANLWSEKWIKCDKVQSSFWLHEKKQRKEDKYKQSLQTLAKYWKRGLYFFPFNTLPGNLTDTEIFRTHSFTSTGTNLKLAWRWTWKKKFKYLSKKWIFVWKVKDPPLYFLLCYRCQPLVSTSMKSVWLTLWETMNISTNSIELLMKFQPRPKWKFCCLYGIHRICLGLTIDRSCDNLYVLYVSRRN